MRVLTTPWKKELIELTRSVKNSIDVAMPFLSFPVLTEIFEHLVSGTRKIDLRFIVRLNGKDFAQGIADYRSYEWLATRTEVKVLSNLHAKVYIFNSSAAIVTSSNLTLDGIQNNAEMGILVEEAELVAEIKRHFNCWWQNSVPINLDALAPLVESLNKMKSQTRHEEKERQKIARRISRLASPVRQEHVEDEILTTIEEDDWKFIKQTLIPQADDMAKVAEVPILVSEGKLYPREYSKFWSIDPRQGQYYATAACALGLVRRTKTARGFEYSLTPLGRLYVQANTKDRLAILRQAVINAPIIRLVAKKARVDLGTLLVNIHESKKLTDTKIVQTALRETGIISKGTVSRRAQTIIAWIRWLLEKPETSAE